MYSHEVVRGIFWRRWGPGVEDGLALQVMLNWKVERDWRIEPRMGRGRVRPGVVLIQPVGQESRRAVRENRERKLTRSWWFGEGPECAVTPGGQQEGESQSRNSLAYVKRKLCALTGSWPEVLKGYIVSVTSATPWSYFPCCVIGFLADSPKEVW